MGCPTIVYPPSGSLASANYGQNGDGTVTIPASGVAQFAVGSWVPSGAQIAFIQLSVLCSTVADAIAVYPCDENGNNASNPIRPQVANIYNDILGWAWVRPGNNIYVKNYWTGGSVNVVVRVLGYS